MVLRHGWLHRVRRGAGRGTASAQSPTGTPAQARRPRLLPPSTAPQARDGGPGDAGIHAAGGQAAAAPPQAGVPHTLAEALAATYSNQPALQAERAKLRATDENVPQALAGWRPTVVMAGTAGYGDGIEPRSIRRIFRRLFSTRRPTG